MILTARYGLIVSRGVRFEGRDTHSRRGAAPL
jgi:hypothetical protein